MKNYQESKQMFKERKMQGRIQNCQVKQTIKLIKKHRGNAKEGK